MFASHGSNAAAKKPSQEVIGLLERKALNVLFLPLLIPDHLKTNPVHGSYIV